MKANNSIRLGLNIGGQRRNRFGTSNCRYIQALGQGNSIPHVTTAEAKLSRPLKPVNVAGVARRCAAGVIIAEAVNREQYYLCQLSDKVRRCRTRRSGPYCSRLPFRRGMRRAGGKDIAVPRTLPASYPRPALRSCVGSERYPRLRRPLRFRGGLPLCVHRRT